MTQSAGPETGSVTSHAAVFGNTDPERFDRLINSAWFGVPPKGRYAIEREWDKIGRRYRRRSRSEYNYDVPIPWFVVRDRFEDKVAAKGVLRAGAYTCISSGTVSFLDSWVSCLSDESLETCLLASKTSSGNRPAWSSNSSVTVARSWVQAAPSCTPGPWTSTPAQPLSH